MDQSESMAKSGPDFNLRYLENLLFFKPFLETPNKNVQISLHGRLVMGTSFCFVVLMEIPNKSSFQKLLPSFGNYLGKMIIGCPSTEILFWLVEKYGHLGTRQIFLCINRENHKKYNLVKNYRASMKIIWLN